MVTSGSTTERADALTPSEPQAFATDRINTSGFVLANVPEPIADRQRQSTGPRSFWLLASVSKVVYAWTWYGDA